MKIKEYQAYKKHILNYMTVDALKADLEYHTPQKLVRDGFFINHKKGDHSNDYSLTIEDYKNTKIRVANSSTVEYFDNIDDAGDYLIEQLNF